MLLTSTASTATARPVVPATLASLAALAVPARPAASSCPYCALATNWRNNFLKRSSNKAATTAPSHCYHPLQVHACASEIGIGNALARPAGRQQQSLHTQTRALTLTCVCVCDDINAFMVSSVYWPQLARFSDASLESQCQSAVSGNSTLWQ